MQKIWTYSCRQTCLHWNSCRCTCESTVHLCKA